MDQKARRRHVVPAFGEWNYYYQCDHGRAAATAAEVMRSAPVVAVAAAAADEWYASYSYGGAVATAEACSDVWFKYSPPPRRPTPKKSRRPEGRVVFKAQALCDRSKHRARLDLNECLLTNVT
uniref:Uncharacterized protein n=1 Tax=Oryza brachyantha TaxID=4533 RepID=J3NCZ2_ORYBR